jgi:hypothetical protein
VRIVSAFELISLRAQNPTARVYAYDGEIVSMKIGKDLYVSRKRFGKLTDREIRELREDCIFAGLGDPHGLSHVVGMLFKKHHIRIPKLPARVRKFFEKSTYGGWIETRPCTGVVHKYDICSAYLSAGYALLPGRGWRRSEKLEDGGFYRGDFTPGDYYPHGVDPDSIIPYEIARQIPDFKITEGYVPSDYIDISPVLDELRLFRSAKALGRTYWGGWGARGKLIETTVRGNTREIGGLSHNLAWACQLTFSIKARIWSIVRNVQWARIYVDSVHIVGTLQTGSEIGDWRHEATYESGITCPAPNIVIDNATGRLVCGRLPRS